MLKILQLPTRVERSSVSRFPILKRISFLALFILFMLGFSTKSEAQVGSALSFDGTDDYVAVNNPFTAFQKEITVEWWVYIVPNQTYTLGSGIGQSTVGVDNMSNNVWLMHFNGSGSKLQFYVNDNGTWRTHPEVSIPSGWHHLAGVADPSGTRLFIDGSLAASGAGISTGIWSNANAKIHFGKDVRFNAGRFMPGIMDEIRIWSRAICQGELQNNKFCEIPGAAPNLEGNYHFNQGVAGGNNSTETTLLDASGNGRHGTLVNMGLTGSNSNWVTPGGIINGTNCAPFAYPSATITAGGPTNFCMGGSVVLSANTNPNFTYQWKKNGVNIPGATGSTYTANTAGDYTVLITNLGCSGLSSPTTVVVYTTDTDGDGVADVCDLDDDNDGILDATECNVSNFYWSNPPTVNGNNATGTINGIGYTYSSSSPIEVTSSVFAHQVFPASYAVPNVNPTIKNTQVTNNTLTFASPMKNPVLVFSSIGGFNSVPITFSSPIEILWSTAVVQNSPTQITGTEGYAIIRLNGTFSSISFNYLQAENWCNFAFGADFTTCGDTDNDGIPDYVDIDSDNDGCSDAVEGAAGFLLTQTVNNRLSGGVNASGIPLIAGAGQAIGTSKTSSASCSCQANIDRIPPSVGVNNVTVNISAVGSASISVAQINNGSSDACGIAEMTLSKSTFNCSNIGANNVVLSVKDNNGNIGTATAVVTVVDAIPPIVNTQNITVNLDASGNATVLASQINNASRDNCSLSTMFLSKNSFNCSNLGANTVTLTVVDASGNSNTGTAVITVVDAILPTVITKNITVNLDASGNATVTPAQINNGSTDNCSIVSYSLSKTNFDCTNVGANTVTLTATDANGNSNTGTAIVTVAGADTDGDGVADACDLDDDNDGILDVTECNKSNFYWSNPPSVNGNVASGTINGIAYTYTSSLPVATTTSVYNHGIYPTSYGVPNNNPTIRNDYISTNTLTFASPMKNPVLVFSSIGNGGLYVPIEFDQPIQILWSTAVVQNSATKITGNEGYAIIRLNGTFSSIGFKYLANESWVNFVFGADFTTCGDTDNDGIPDYVDTDSDNDGCSDAIEGSLSFAVNQTSNGRLIGAVNAQGVPLLAGAGQGNGTSQSFIANCFCQPTIDKTLPTVVTKNITVALNSLGQATVTAAQVNDGSSDNCGISTLTLSKTTFNCSNLGDNTVTLTVKDVNNNSSTGTATVTVIDNMLPQITCAGNIQLTATGASGAVATFPTPSATDNCSFTITQTAGLTSGSTFPIGTTTNTFEVVDGSGNKATCSFDVNVVGIAPSIVSPGTINVFSNATSCDAAATYTATETTGIPASTITYSIAPGSTFNVGTTAVTATASNAVGTSQVTFNVVVTDNVMPTINCIANINQFATSASGALVNYTAPTGSDNCTYTISQTAGLASGSTFPIGTTTNTYEIVDASGNKATCSFDVVITGLPPVIVSPGTITANSDANACSATVTYAATETTAIPSSTITYSIAPGSVFNVGTTQVTATATNPVGTSQVTFDVVVSDNTAPTAIAQNVSIALNASGMASITAADINNNSSDACGIASISINKANFDCSNVGDNTVVLTVTDIHGNSSTANATVHVSDNIAPEINAVVDQSQCFVNSGSYTIENVTASDNCSIASSSYVITGATNRFGTGLDASGAFNIGTSTITWSVSDPSNNTTTSSATFTVYPLPVASLISSDNNTFCNEVTLTANSSLPGNNTYMWSTGETTQSISLDALSADGIYTVYVISENGCNSAQPASYNYQKQNLVNSYTILVNNEVEMKGTNTVQSGSVGVMKANGEAEFEKGVSIVAAGTFTKSPKYKLKNTVSITNKLTGIATVGLPTMQAYTGNANNLPSYTVNKNTTVTLNANYKDLSVKKGANVTVNGSLFRKVTIEEGSTVRFTSPVINIEDLSIGNGKGTTTRVRFSGNTSIRIKDRVKIEGNCIINQDNYIVTFYYAASSGCNEGDEDKFSVKGGNTSVTANVIIPGGKIKVENEGDDDDDCHGNNNGGTSIYMTGLYVANNLKSEGSNIFWNSFSCSATSSRDIFEVSEPAVAETLEMALLAYPNPASQNFNFKVETMSEDKITFRIFDIAGRIVYENKEGNPNEVYNIGEMLSPGTYMIEATQADVHKVLRVVKTQ